MTTATLRTPLHRIRQILPQGGSLPDEDWRRRHAGLLGLLVVNVIVLAVYSVSLGRARLIHNIDATAAVGLFAMLGATTRIPKKLRSVAVSMGLLTAAALFVDYAGGRIEAHFYFFVLVMVLTLYEDWLPFLVAVGFVLIHHGVIGTLDPKAVFDRPEAWNNPWEWAGIHAAFVAAAGAAAIGTWRLNENVRGKMRATHQRLQEVSETDSLTALANRRKLMGDLEELLTSRETAILVILDLNGFKTYNDTFGHPAGDSLLVRLAGRLQDACKKDGKAYRLGGDEFCVVWRSQGAGRAHIEAAVAAVMSESGEGFSVTASYGSVAVPEEATTMEAALRTADHRMYEQKHGSRPSPRSQSHSVLVQALAERHPELSPHVDAVTALAAEVARQVGLPPDAVEHVKQAAELHDIGKVAIPDAIINKPGPLDEEEWEFMRRHTIVGERILRAAPALAAVAALVRASHERFDGGGYPDRLAGEDIPIGSRIIAVCDAYDAMTSNRPYRLAQHPDDALAELQRCSGAQFDPQVVEAFEKALGKPRPLQASAQGNGNAGRAAARSKG